MKKFNIAAVAAIALLFSMAWHPFLIMAQETNNFKVLDISERTYDGGPSIAVVLSEALDPTIRHDSNLVISDGQAVLKSVWILSDDGRTLYYPNVKPETEYSVTVLKTLASASGSTLEDRVSKVVATRKITPGVNFVGDGLLLPKDLSEGLPVATINVPLVEIEFFRINDKGLREFIDWGSNNIRRYYDYISMANKFGELAFSGRFDLDAPTNKRVVRHIPVMEINSLKKPGVYFAVLRQPGEYNYNYQTTYFLVTDVALHARVYADQTVIAASSLASGRPLAGAEIEVFDHKVKLIWKGKTDKSGLATCPKRLTSSKQSFIKAQYQGQIGLIPLDIPALDLSEFELHKRPNKQIDMFMYSARDLYRPGEKAVIVGLLRNQDGRSVDSTPLRAVLFRPDGKKVRNFTWRPEPVNQAGPGCYKIELNISPEAQTGRWRLEVRDDPAKPRPISVFNFQVEDFLPERMRLELTSRQAVLFPDQAWEIDVKGEYLYGAPAAGSTLQTGVRIRAIRELYEGLPGFEFGDVNNASYGDDWDEPEIKLDKDGLATIIPQNRWNKLDFPVVIRASFSLFETGGRPVVRSIEQIMRPAAALVGVRPLFNGEYAQEGMVGFEILKVDQDQTLYQVQGLKISLVREDRDYYWEYNENSGWNWRYTENNYEILADFIDLDGKKPGVFRTDLKNGRYLLTVSDPETNVITSYRFYVGYSWYEGDDARSSRPEKVNLALDKPSYRPGDVIHLTVNPPHAGEGLIMVESSKLLWSKRIAVPGQGLTIDIPVSAAWTSHDIYITALVLRPGEATEKITPNRAVGLIHLPLDRSDRKLELALEVPDRVVIKEENAVKVKLRLSGPPKEKTFVTLAAVDAGILSITDFKTPDPFSFFFGPRRFEIEAYDLYGKVVELQSGDKARLACGGDADLSKGGKRPENNVKLLSLFQGPLNFNQDGLAEAVLNLPSDFNGRIRLMACAFNTLQYGSSDLEIIAAAPLVAQISTPRFLAPKDETELTLDLHNLSGRDQSINLDLTASEPLILEGGQQVVNLKDNEKTTLSIPLKAGLGVGTGLIRLRAEGEDLSVGQDWKLSVRPGYPALAKKIRQSLKEGEKFVPDPNIASDLMNDGLTLDLKISPTVPLDLAGAMRGLIGYPYGCLEQTTSRAFPLLDALPENIKKFGLPFINSTERAARLEKAIERISLMQLSSGGFSLWGEQGPEEPYLTVYATDFLLQSREVGFNPPAEMLDKALTRLEFYLNNQWPGGSDDPNLAEAVRAYAGYVLAKTGRAPLGALRILFDKHRNVIKSDLSMAHLGLALKMMGDEKRSGPALSEAEKIRRENNKYWGDYGSPLRDLAMTMALLLNNGYVPAGLDNMMTDLDDMLRERNWFSTQEQYALFQAGMALDSRREKEWQGDLLKIDAIERVGAKGALLIKPTRPELEQGLSFTSHSPGMLFVSFMASGYPVSPPAEDSSKIFVGRYYYNLEGKPLTGNIFNVGDLILVHLAIKAAQRTPDALVVDFLPAGFEIENPNFKNSLKLDDQNIQNLKLSGHEVWRLQRWNRIVHQEFLNDRYLAALRLDKNATAHLFYLVRVVTPGNFTCPPPTVESMYRPEIRGVGGARENIVVVNQPR